ncbi:reverse transcriptase domain-containing protein [Tanacetum coccineum]
MGEHEIEFRGRNLVKGQILADFLAETPSKEEEGAKDEKAKRKEPEPEKAWKLFTDGASSSDGSGAGLILVSPEGKEYTYALRFEFETTNNEAEYKTLLAGLRIAKEIRVQELTIFVDSQLVANQGNGLFKARQIVIKQYLEKSKELLANFPCHSIKHIKRDQNKKAGALSKLASMTFPKLAKEVLVEVIQDKSITQKEVTYVTQEKEDRWMIPIQEYQQLGKLPDDPQKARNLRIKAQKARRYTGKHHSKKVHQGYAVRPIPKIILVAMVKMYRRNTGQKHHPRSTSRFMRNARRLGKAHQGWVDELPQVLWAHRKTPKSSNRETSFSLVYSSEAMVPIEISIETRRIQDFDLKQNEKRRREDLDILKERREIASIKEAHYKQKLEGYYNKHVRPSTFKPVKKSYGDGAYKLETLSGSPID